MIPIYEEIILPFLKILVAGNEHTLNETHDKLVEHFKLSNDEVRELLPSGQQPTKTAYKLHKNIDAAEYKHVVLWLILNFSPKNVVKL